METEQFLTGKDVAKRWGVHPQTVNRRRKQGLLNWINLNAGISERPIVRFRLSDIIEFEKKTLTHGVTDKRKKTPD